MRHDDRVQASFFVSDLICGSASHIVRHEVDTAVLLLRAPREW